MEKRINSGIYQIINKVTHHKYIGSSYNLLKRFKDHKILLKYNKHSNRHLQNAWNKYREEAFEFKTLIYCDINNLLLFEQIFIDYINPEYNILKLAGTTKGQKWTEKSRLKAKKPKGELFKKKISDSMLGKVRFCKTYPGLVSPSGDIFTNITNLNKFSREHNIISDHLYGLFNKKRTQHRGWKLLDTI